jgi:hypothetical protein
MDAHSQFIKDALKVLLRSLNIRMANHNVRGMTACGGRTGEPLVTDILRTNGTYGQGYADVTVRFPTKSDEVPGVDATNTLPERTFGLTLDPNERFERPLEGETVRIETEHGTFRGVVFHDQALWGIRWTSEFSKSIGKGQASGSDSSSGSTTPGRHDPKKGGFEFL